MATLLFQLRGPMQSWGVRSRFDVRDTLPYPSKSGVLGLLAAALGRDREEDISDLAGLRLGVRVDRPGVIKVDYQTVHGVINISLQKPHNVQSWRYYLADAAFLAGVEGEKELLEQIYRALQSPRWPLFLGRKSYLPSPPPFLRDGLREESLERALRTYPYLLEEPPKEDLLLVLEVEEGQGRAIYDQPIAPFAERKFGVRYVRETLISVQEVPFREGVHHVDH